MKHILIVLLSLTGFYAAFKATEAPQMRFDKAAYDLAIQKKAKSLISCVPDWKTYSLNNEEIMQMVPLPGTGSHKWQIKVKHDSAQFYFNQGMNLYYGFHIAEALPSFKKAQLFDSTSPMLYWAEALAYGPNINDMGYAASPAALTALAKATDLLPFADQREALLINAMSVRYSADTAMPRLTLNQQYSDKMKALYKLFPKDAEVAALYADALMLQHPWDLWEHSGKPKAWTPEIEKVLEHTLSFAPRHLGANHYYIHVMEASPYAYKASASADRLSSLAPGLAHMVHMPSHIYIRTGKYEKGAALNTAALKQFKTYLALYPGAAAGAFLYDNHNRFMQVACSMNGNNYPVTLKDAMENRMAIDTAYLSMPAPLGSYLQYAYMSPELAMLTFNKWDEILAQPDIPGRYHYATLLQHFAKGMAMANTNDLTHARTELENIRRLIIEPDLSVVLEPFNSASASARIAETILAGTIAQQENKLKKALQYYRAAVIAEDALVYNEPRDWLNPARHYLGNALLQNREFAKAAKVFREDLAVQPLNATASRGWKKAIGKIK